MNNFIRVRSMNPFRQNFMYIDAPEYLADQIFIRHRLRIRFKKEFSSEQSPFLIIFCSCARNRVKDFEDSMEELSRAVLIMGYAGYGELCSDLSHKLCDS